MMMMMMMMIKHASKTYGHILYGIRVEELVRCSFLSGFCPTPPFHTRHQIIITLHTLQTDLCHKAYPAV